jgi:hypothetical protein
MMANSTSNNQKKPAKPLPVINIPDGEFLRYGNYVKEEKFADYYLVTKKEKNGNGNVFYRIYIDVIPVSENRKPAEDYTKWPAYSLVDAKLGSVIEAGGNFKTNVLKNWLGSVAKLVFWQYKLDLEKGQVDYVSRYINGKEKKRSVKIIPGLPCCDFMGALFFYQRFLDIQKGDVAAFINPEYFNVPFDFSLENVSQEKVRTDAGTFDTTNYTFIVETPPAPVRETIKLLFKDPGTILYFITHRDEEYTYCIENSERKLLIKEHIVVRAGDYILEEISSVK